MARPSGHASHEACELKFYDNSRRYVESARHASHEACELKLPVPTFTAIPSAVTPRMRRVS